MASKSHLIFSMMKSWSSPIFSSVHGCSRVNHGKSSMVESSQKSASLHGESGEFPGFSDTFPAGKLGKLGIHPQFAMGELWVLSIGGARRRNAWVFHLKTSPNRRRILCGEFVEVYVTYLKHETYEQLDLKLWLMILAYILTICLGFSRGQGWDIMGVSCLVWKFSGTTLNPLINHDQSWSIMINHDQSWSIMINHDQSWSIMINHDQSWSIMINHDQSWSIMINHDQSWSIMINHDQSWSIMINHDQSWSIMINHHVFTLQINNPLADLKPQREIHGGPWTRTPSDDVLDLPPDLAKLSSLEELLVQTKCWCLHLWINKQKSGNM